MLKDIVIQGARTHNLKNIHVTLPRDRLIVLTGLSGSGKSSLAFDTLYAEGQRRYVESLSAYARQFLSLMEKPDVDHIEGLSPAISIEQKTTSHNPRSTVGTVTEIYDYLRLLYARVGTPHCPEHGTTLKAYAISEMIKHIFKQGDEQKLVIRAPLVRDEKGTHQKLLDQLSRQGYTRIQVDGEMVDIDDCPTLDKNQKHQIDVIIDRFYGRSSNRSRLADALETATRLSGGLVFVDINKDSTLTFSSEFACADCGFSAPALEPKHFSFNSPQGACQTCDGLGVHEFFSEDSLIQSENLSLSQGAIHGWTRQNVYYYHLLCALAKHFDFSMDTPFKKLPKKIKQILFHGSTEKIKFEFGQSKGLPSRTQRFEGIIPSMTRRFHDSDSEALKANLKPLLSKQSCPDCQGKRLNPMSCHVMIKKQTLPTLMHLSIEHLLTHCQNIKLTGKKKQIAEKILKEINARLQFLMDVGLDYLTLGRTADTLSGGESQRIRLASQIGSGLMGVMYVLDEPSIGLHQRDNHRLIQTLRSLKAAGNTVIVVEHDEEAILAADYVLDLGPAAGIHGGEVVAQGHPDDIIKSQNSLTADYLSGRKVIHIDKEKPPAPEQWLTIKKASGNNLKNITAQFPVGQLTCVTGVSGSGKSTLVNQTLYPRAQHVLNRAHLPPTCAPCQAIEGLDNFDKVVAIDQSPIGRTPRSNAATYTGLFTPIRELFAQTTEARARGYGPGRFSFNVKGGRCEACQGDGVMRVEMHFLSDMYVTCDVCHGQRYNAETLEIKYKDNSIDDVLNMTIEEGYAFFKAIPVIAKKLETLIAVGLSYLKLGQSALTLSGGEAQRIKLSKELSRRDTGQTLYILDEPTTGLHFHDVQLLLNVLHTLQARGNTVIVIEHNLDVIKTADWIIDIGPEGGDKGGTILGAGMPEDLSKIKSSYTGQYLKKILS